TMTLDAVEFVRRFLMHVLPAGFVRVRHYGLLANRHRQEKLARCRELLGMAGPEQAELVPADPDPTPPPVREATVTATGVVAFFWTPGALTAAMSWAVAHKTRPLAASWW